MCTQGPDLLKLIFTASSRVCWSETDIYFPSSAWRGRVQWSPILFGAKSGVVFPTLAHCLCAISANVNPVKKTNNVLVFFIKQSDLWNDLGDVQESTDYRWSSSGLESGRGSLPRAAEWVGAVLGRAWGDLYLRVTVAAAEYNFWKVGKMELDIIAKN